jgi:hypothetical protein
MTDHGPRARVVCALCGRLMKFAPAIVQGRYYCPEHAALIRRGEHVPPEPLEKLPTLADEAARALAATREMG